MTQDWKLRLWILMWTFIISGKALAGYSKNRKLDAHAICDLAMYNYIEVIVIDQEKHILYYFKFASKLMLYSITTVNHVLFKAF